MRTEDHPPIAQGVIGAGAAFWLPTYLEQHLTGERCRLHGHKVVGGFSADYILDLGPAPRLLALFALGSALAARAYVVLPPAPPGWLGYNIGGGIGAFRLAAIGVAAAHVGLSDAPERLWRTAPRNSSNGNTHGGRRMLTKDRDAPVDSSMI